MGRFRQNHPSEEREDGIFKTILTSFGFIATTATTAASVITYVLVLQNTVSGLEKTVESQQKQLSDTSDRVSNLNVRLLELVSDLQKLILGKLPDASNND